ncbi:MAG: hypothetical protein ACOYKD_07510 [Anaerolineaceae bacterium]|jgi:hypothetical protein
MKRERITFALLLIIIGGALMARQFYPQIDWVFLWPNWGLALGLLMILLAAVNRSGGLTVLGSLLAGFATNLIIQDFYGGTVWLSMLTFLGVGLILANWFDYQKNGDWRAGLTLILLSLVIFMLTGGTNYLPWPQVTTWWPVGLIVLGLIVLISAFGKKRKSS